MRLLEKDGAVYRLPDHLNDFQEKLYLHLIQWKWRHITREPGYLRNQAFDAIIPDNFMKGFPVIYPAALDTLKHHRTTNPFRFHRHFANIASSQAAAVNLFLPLLSNPRAGDVLRAVKPDVQELATDCLENGYRLEYWGDTRGRGLLGDHSIRYGTDADIAIAYYNREGQRCLWLIEHKLSETEFSRCQGATSEGRKPHHDCGKSFTEILGDRRLCYYHDAKGFKYWDITGDHREFFTNHTRYEACPFRGGMNQLWRNQLLGFKLEDEQRFHRVDFSVVKHPGNTAIDRTINAYRELTGGNERFSVLTSAEIINAAASVNDGTLTAGVEWYRDMYMVG